MHVCKQRERTPGPCTPEASESWNRRPELALAELTLVITTTAIRIATVIATLIAMVIAMQCQSATQQQLTILNLTTQLPGRHDDTGHHHIQLLKLAVPWS